MIDPRRYAVRVQFVEDGADSYFEATVDELPGVAAFEATHKKAYDTVIEAIKELQIAAVSDGRPFPEPVRWSETDVSGRITLRMPRSLHRSLDLQARQEDVSLNQHIVAILAAGSAVAYAKEAIGEKMQAVLTQAFYRPKASSNVFSPVVGRKLMNVNTTVYATSSLPSVDLAIELSQRQFNAKVLDSAVHALAFANPGIDNLC